MDSWDAEQALALVQRHRVTNTHMVPTHILAFLDGRLARMKWPVVIDFIGEMPRDPSGKLLKRRLRDPYWQARDRAI
jgi:long-chain acyl-CoA synthetase